jgi:predicted transcriptional regulator
MTRAEAVMTSDVIALRPDMSLAEAAEILQEHQVSGAPVVNHQGVCVGVLTAADFVKSEQYRGATSRFSEAVSWTSNRLPEDFFSEDLAGLRDRIVPSTGCQVSQVMTRDLMTVSQRTQLKHVIACMVTARVHRVFVLDPDDRLAGVITTMDILAALLKHAPISDIAADSVPAAAPLNV